MMLLVKSHESERRKGLSRLEQLVDEFYDALMKEVRAPGHL